MIGTGAIDRARELPPADELHRDGDAATDEVAQDEPEPHALTERGAGVRIAHAREHGIHRRADPGELHWEYLAFVLPVSAAAWWLESRGRRLTAFALVASLAGGGFWFIKRSAAPVLDQLVSARGLWRRVQPQAADTCIDSLHRNWRYGLNYYSHVPLPDCGADPRPIAVTQQPRSMPRLEPRRPPAD